jgi:pimeloyl-ACP methyl ester carboxylesterase
MADYEALMKRPSGIQPLLWVVSGAFKTGWRGVLQDMRITINPWDFSIGDIPASIPTQIFQGAEDVCVTVDMAQHLQKGIPGAKLTVFPGEGHLSVVMYQASVMLQAAVAASGS